ncbi:divalent metal cation transporter [Burkholderia territorii]|uniref:Nramp family divalent metal transporter n=1 Tax=Burkholderia territorii TaxID=1503055 RepID=UPI000758FC2A|nr:Nramp family divalent metal transporter [Burkholderia territorii]KUY88580.1 divalent metal cation transporter [Burkholderia territorii]KUZ07769.1 divalent metal cation transporter [Burkholderia territorii]
MATLDRNALTERTATGMRDVFAGRRRAPRAALLFAGPAIIASVAYMDPGNFATNIRAGAQFGYTLLWVVLLANVIAMLFQALSAKLGIATGRNLAELCRMHFPPPVVVGMWAASELAAMATELAEFLGGAIALALLFKLPTLGGMGVMAVVTYGILLADRNGVRPMEIAIGVLVGVIGLCYLAEMFIAPVAWAEVGLHAVVPGWPRGEALTISVGIVGATIMPHALYLHSGLTQRRVAGLDTEQRRMMVRFSNWEVVVALSVAGAVNMAMVVMASAAFHAGYRDVAEIATAYRTLTPLLGAAAATCFLVSLMSAGISSSVVGTMAGQMIMEGFVGYRIPVWLRRLVTMVPAFFVIGLGVDSTQALVISQVVLSFVLPVPMLALVYFTGRRDIMGTFANGRATRWAANGSMVVICMLNIILLARQLSQ